MAKKDFNFGRSGNRSRRLDRKTVRQYISDKENREVVNKIIFPKRDKEDGLHKKVVEAYEKGGLMAAYHTFCVYNKNKIYAKEDFYMWIKEYDENQNSQKVENNGNQGQNQGSSNNECKGRNEDDDAR